MKLRKGDLVQMLSGKDRSKQGKILRVYSEEGKVVVEGLNILKKHRRPRKQGQQGQIIEVPRKVWASTVGLVCASCKKTTRIGTQLIDGQKKQRICKKCNAPVLA